MSAPRLRGAEATGHTAEIRSKNCSAVSSQDAVATAAQARAAAQLLRLPVPLGIFFPPAATRAGTAQRAIPTIALNTYRASRTCESCNRHTGETPVPLPSESDGRGSGRRSFCWKYASCPTLSGLAIGRELLKSHRQCMTTKKGLITGITGQDGSYLAELLLAKDYEVHGIIRRASTFNTGRLDGIYSDPHTARTRLFLHYGDLSDASALARIIGKIQPGEIYNLAAQSHVRVSFDSPEYTADITATGTVRLLEAIRETGIQPRFYQASSSEMYGLVREVPQTERTPFYPRSPYGCAKVFSYWITVNYRESYGLHISNGILFNHESPRRGETFVTRKITRAVAHIKAGLQDKLYLGNLDARRDWGYAREYIEAMWRMLQQEQPDDYVIATSETHSIREFLDAAFGYAGLDWKKYVEIDPRYFRPAEVDLLIGDYSKARRKLGWEAKTKFKELVKLMVDEDV